MSFTQIPDFLIDSLTTKGLIEQVAVDGEVMYSLNQEQVNLGGGS